MPPIDAVLAYNRWIDEVESPLEQDACSAFIAGWDAREDAVEQLAEADLSPCGHPSSRINMDWNTMEFWCMDCGR